MGEAAYRSPPAVSSAAVVSPTRVAILGVADPGARVRLATPAGQAAFADTDGAGQWRILLGDSAGVRLFGLSMSDDHRVVQAQSYLALTPGAVAVQLRSGAGAVVLAPSGGLSISALDFDRKGGAVVSGQARPGADVDVAVDGALRGHVIADPEGRYALDLDEPLGPGDHQFEAIAAGGRARVAARVLPPPSALRAGPFEANRAEGAWRIVWVTPGGGEQTTLIFDRGRTA